jgi:peptidyl-prolyl cis-trans isomerase C
MTERNSNTPSGTLPTLTHPVLLGLGLLVCSALLHAQAPLRASAPADRTIARVNGVAITESQLRDESENLYPSHSAHGGLRPEKLTEVRHKALDELIIHELVWQRAQATGAVTPMARVRAEHRRLRTKFGAKRFDQSLQTSGLTLDAYLKNLQRRMTLAAMFEKHVVAPSRLSPAALRAYYQKNRQKFSKPESVKARLILASVEDFKNGAQERAARQKIDQVYSQLKAGKDFGLLAEQFSDDFYKVKGGDLGWVHRGRLEPDFEKVAFTLAPGTYSAPFRTPYGYNILKVEARQPARQIPYAEIRSVLKYSLEQENIQQRRAAWNAELRKGANIEIVSPDLRARR